MQKVLSYPVVNHVTDACFAASEFGAEWSGDHYVLPNTIGEGRVEAYDYGYGSVMISQFKLCEALKIERTHSDIKGQLIFGFILSGATSKFVVGPEANLGKLHFGAHISTPSTVSYGHFSHNIWHRQLSILVQKQWLEGFLAAPLPDILHDPDTPLFIVLEMTIPLAKSLRMLFETDLTLPFRKKQIELKCQEALLLLSGSLMRNPKAFQQKRHHPEDLNKVLSIAGYLDAHIRDTPTVLEIAQQFHVNKDKLQAIFKSVYGETISSYIKRSKMERAYTLLAKGYSVSEVGHQVGYRNLSHFARAFKSIYTMNPSEVTRQF